MSKIIQKNVPEGTRDLIFEEVLAQRRLEAELMELYAKLGFSPVCTPTLEYCDVFDHDRQCIPQEEIFQFTDRSGRLVALRPDNTSPIARVASSKLRDAALPLKICYSQNVYRAGDAYHARRSEILQSGVEILGGDPEAEDLCCLFTALQTMAACSQDYKIEIGYANFFEILLFDEQISQSERADLKNYIAAKNSSGFSFSLNAVAAKAVELAAILPRLCGGADVLKKARELAEGNERALAILSYLESIYQAFSDAGYGERIIIDLGIVQNIDYYTGLVFKGYQGGIGEEVLSGGRYDNLLGSFGYPLPACGFALNLSEAAAAKEKPAAPAAFPIDFKAGSQDIRRAGEYLKNIGRDA